MSFANITLAIAEYERSMVFVNNAWKAYVEGDLTALDEQQKQGALLFFSPLEQGGAACSSSHSGDHFSDGLHHVLAFPSIGPGKGDGNIVEFSDPCRVQFHHAFSDRERQDCPFGNHDGLRYIPRLFPFLPGSTG